MALLRKVAYAILEALVGLRMWLTAEPNGHFSKMREERIEPIRNGSYHSFRNRYDHWEVLSVDRAKDLVVLRSVRSLVEIQMKVDAFGELMTFDCAFTPATYEQIKGTAPSPAADGPTTA